MSIILSTAMDATAGLARVALSPFWTGPALLSLACFSNTLLNACTAVADRFPALASFGVPSFLLSPAATTGLWIAFGLGIVIRANRALNKMAANSWTLVPGKGWEWPDEIAVVTGGSSGIGKDIVKKLSARGIRVAVLDIQTLPPDLQNNSRVRFYQCDVTSSESVSQAANAVRQDIGHPSILINNAGIAQGCTILKTDEKYLRRILSVNLMSMWFTTQQFLPSMIERNKGHVVTMASLASFLGLATAADYAATKAGALSFHESLTSEIKHVHKTPGIMTTIVHPNFVRTPMIIASGVADKLEKAGMKLLTSEQVAENVVAQIMSRRGGQLIIPRSHSPIAGLRAWPLWFQELVRDTVAGS